MIAFLAKQNLLILPERFPKYIPIISFREKFISFIKTIRLLMVSRKNLWAKKKNKKKGFNWFIEKEIWSTKSFEKKTKKNNHGTSMISHNNDNSKEIFSTATMILKY